MGARFPGAGSFRAIILAAGCGLLLASCSNNANPAAHDATASDNPDNWTGYGRTAGEQHFSPLTDINDGNVGRLGLAWSFDLDPGNAVSAPVAADGILYIATGYSVVRAFEAATGKLLWEHDPKAARAAGRKLRQGWGIRGLAYSDGAVFVGTHDGRLLALDAKTGKERWSAMTVSADDGRYITGAPRVFDGKVIIGHGGADVADIRGYVTAYDARTGRQLWRFHTVPGNPADGFENKAMEMAAKTWSGDWWKYGGGGTVWNAMTYDPGQKLIILGTGNGAPWNHKIRSKGEGDNLFLASIVALDAATGAYRWHYQVNPGESWDYNAAMDMQLADLEIGGARRQVLMTAPKNGFFYVIDRTNGKLISAEPYAHVSWASRIDTKTGRPIETPGARYPDGQRFTMWPGPIGAHSWLPMAFSPRAGLAYIPAIEMGATYSDAGIEKIDWKRSPGMVMDGGTFPDFAVNDPARRHGSSELVAWDPVRQKTVWKVRTLGPWGGGVMATGGNLVFQGQIDGKFTAYAADSGKPLWRFDAQAPVLAPPISYRSKGRQYVTVLTGLGTSGASYGALLPVRADYRTQARRVLTFVIDGTAKLPPAEKADLTPFDDPDFRADPALAQFGALQFANHCGICHGGGAVGAGQAPDLRMSAIVPVGESFTDIVRGGALVDNGMPRFEELDDRTVEAIRHYVRSEAAVARGK